MTEIERKFLVLTDGYKNVATSKEIIAQGYLNTDPERTVRIRIKGDRGFLTIKGKSNDSGTTRFEWEKEIPLVEAQALFKICEKGSIRKTRFIVPAGAFIFEVDEFYDANLGLVVAEIELNNENDAFLKPDWLGKEVTGDAKYYNSHLIKVPFTTW